MSRGLAQKRHNRKRLIRNRLLKHKLRQGSRKDNLNWPLPNGILNKYNLVCSCEMCSDRYQNHLEEKKKRQETKKEIEKELISND